MKKGGRQMNLDSIRLTGGSHFSRDEGTCFMEAVAWFAGLPHTDHPECTCPVIAAFMRRYQDLLAKVDVEALQRLKVLIPVVLDTKRDRTVERARAWMCVDFTVRVAAPAHLRACGFTAEANVLAGLAEIVGTATWESVTAIVQKTRDAMRERRNEARHILTARVTAAVKERLSKEKPAYAAAYAAYAAASAAAYAAAAASAAAYAAYAAAYAAASAADAYAYAYAADAYADADADAEADTYVPREKVVYERTLAHLKDRFAPVRTANVEAAISLVRRMAEIAISEQYFPGNRM